MDTIPKELGHLPTPSTQSYDEVGAIIAYENGDLEEAEIVELFQHLVDNGHAWTFQGSYGRTAIDLIRAGLISAPKSFQLP